MLVVILLIEFIVIGVVVIAEIRDYKTMEKEAENRKYDFYDKLLELQDLKEKNIITEEEFEAEKKKIKN